MVLMEAMVALSILTVLGLVLLKLSLNILHPRQWVLQQTLTDAYMTYERAYAERIPFENLLAGNSPWPAFPTTTTTVVEIGRLPGNRPVTGDGDAHAHRRHRQLSDRRRHRHRGHQSRGHEGVEGAERA